MTLFLPTLAVGFAAFCVWLTVRIINRRERWTKWTMAAVVALPALYFVSFGPACWLVREEYISYEAGAAFHRALLLTIDQGPKWIGWPLWEYSRLCGASNAQTMMRLIAIGSI